MKLTLSKASDRARENFLTSRSWYLATATPKYPKYAGDPIAFIEQELGYTLTTEQKLICDRFAEGGAINVQAAHGVGKSLLAACLTVYNTVVMERETITTAPTFRQVAHVLWKEIRKIRSKVKIAKCEGGQTFLRYNSGSAFGFTAQHNNTDAFQGQHAPGLVGIEDEACGISQAIDDGMLACAVDAESVVLRIGNPTDNRTPFAKHCRNDGAIVIPVWTHPNVSWAYDREHRLYEWVRVAIGLQRGKCQPRSRWLGQLKNFKDPIPGAISIEWIEKIRHGFGEESAFWISRVNALFPENVADGIIPLSWLKAARVRYDADPEYWDNLSAKYYWQLGADVADGGGDNHAIAFMRGRSVLYNVQTIVPKADYQDTMHLADELVAIAKRLPQSQFAIDNLGVGAGTLGRVIQQGYLAQACTFSSAPTDTPTYGTKYNNLRTQVYWEFREALQRSDLAIAPLEDEEGIFEELSAVEYIVNSTGVTVATSKDEVKKKIGRSPDRADAIVMARWLSPMLKPIALPLELTGEVLAIAQSKVVQDRESLAELDRVLGVSF